MMETKKKTNKKLSKKVLIGGVLMVMLAVAVTASLVMYISNTVNADVIVESPLVVHFDETGVDYYDLGTIFGGESVIYTTVTENLASNDINIYMPVTEVTAPTNWEGSEFTSIILDNPSMVPLDVLACMFHVKSDGTLVPFAAISGENTTTARLFWDNDCDGTPNKYTHGSGYVDQNQFNTTTHVGIAPGNYSVKVCYLADLTGSC